MFCPLFELLYQDTNIVHLAGRQFGPLTPLVAALYSFSLSHKWHGLSSSLAYASSSLKILKHILHSSQHSFTYLRHFIHQEKGLFLLLTRPRFSHYLTEKLEWAGQWQHVYSGQPFYQFLSLRSWKSSTPLEHLDFTRKFSAYSHRIRNPLTQKLADSMLSHS